MSESWCCQKFGPPGRSKQPPLIRIQDLRDGRWKYLQLGWKAYEELAKLTRSERATRSAMSATFNDPYKEGAD